MLYLRDSLYVESKNTFEKQQSISRLAKKVAFYRYILDRNQSSPKKMIECMVNNIFSAVKEAEIDFQISKTALTQLFENQAAIMNKGTANIIECAFIYHFHKTNAVFHNIKGVTPNMKQGQRVKISDYSLNSFGMFLKFNCQYAQIFENQLFRQEELSHFFKCSQQKVRQLHEIFLQNKENILQIRYNIIKKLMFQMIAAKMRLIISQSLQLKPFPSEFYIQLAEAQVILPIFMKKQNKSGRLPFANFQSQIGIAQLTIGMKKQIKNRVSNIIARHVQEDIQVSKICKQFNLKLKLVKNLVMSQRLKKQTPSLKINKQSEKHRQIMNLFQFYRYKHNLSTVPALSNLIEKNHNIKARNFIEDFCLEDIRKIKDTEERNYLTFTMQVIKSYMHRQEKILFIDHIDFYEYEFVLYNLLNSSTSIKYVKKPFVPIQNLRCSLVMGITMKNIRFYSITNKRMTVYGYIDQLHTILEKMKDRLPKAVIVHLPISLYKRQWIRLGKMVKFLQDNHRSFFLLPKKDYVPDIFERMQSMIKQKIWPKIAQHIYNDNFQETLASKIEEQIQNIVKSKLVNYLMKKLWNI